MLFTANSLLGQKDILFYTFHCNLILQNYDLHLKLTALQFKKRLLLLLISCIDLSSQSHYIASLLPVF